MSDLVNVFELSFNYNKRIILDEVSFNINPNQVIGLIGKNGAGKTTLLKILGKLIDFDNGQITFTNGIRIGYLPQEFELENDKTVFENISSVDYFENHLLNWEEKENIEKTLKELGITDQTKKIKNLRGGQKKRVALAKAIINNPDLLILDEPTNHLDLETITHLEKLIKNFSGSVVLVSHDRYFLDKVSTQIFELYKSKIYVHKGNYSEYLKSKNIRLNIEEVSDVKRQQILKHEKEWVYSGVKARETKNKGRLKRYYELSSIEDFRRERETKIDLPKPFPLGNKILNLEKLDILTEDQKTVIKDFTFKFTKGMKIGLLGPNGIGKSTFLKSILGQIDPAKGKIIVGQNTFFNYQDQEKSQLNDDNTVFEEVAQSREKIEFGDNLTNSRGYLKRFLFDNDDIKKHIGKLSGGERTRVILAKIVKKGGNFLILDEPTNDLDIETLKALENAIKSFDGCCIIVSHDRYFLNQTCNHILALTGDGEYILNTGNYDKFINRYGLLEELTKNKQKSKINESEEDNKKSAKEERYLKKKLARLESEIPKIEQKIKELEKEFDDPQFYKKGEMKIKEITEEIEKHKKLLSQKEEQWIKLNI